MGRRGLLGREPEVAEIVAALDALSETGSPWILQLVGEPGIGKSRLLAELCDLAEARGQVVLRGRAGEFESELPFGAFVDAFDDYLSTLEAGRFEELDPWMPELASVFSTFAGPAHGRTGPLHAERYRTYRAVRALLEELARTSPVVLVLDDLHWCDSASVELVAYLLTHPPEGGVLLAVALRPTQTDPQLGAALASAVRDGRARRMELPPFTIEQARALLGPCPSHLHDQLYRESGGNPFYLEQLARGVKTQGVARPAPSNPSTDLVPDAVCAALASELASLSPQAQDLLRGAAVVGDPFDADLAARAADQGADDLCQGLDELAASELVRERGTPRTYRFRHPLVRRAIYDSSGPGWRLGAHARVARALEDREAGPVLRAHHVECSAEPGDAAAITLLVEAARATSAHAPLTAARWFAAAVRLLPDSAEYDDRRVELLVLTAVELGGGGKSAESHSMLEEAVNRLPFEHPERTNVVAFLANLEFYLGRLDEGRDRLLVELGRVGNGPSLARARLQVELAVGATFLADVDDLHARATAALATSRAIGHGLLAMVATAILAFAEIMLGHFREAAELLDDGAAAYDALDDHELADRVDAVHWLAMPEMCLGRFNDTIRHCERGIAVSRATGRGHWLVPLMHAKAFALGALGRLAEADEVAHATVEMARLGGQVPALVIAMFEQCVLATARGDLTEAVQAGEEAVALARTFPPSIMRALAGEALARALLEIDEPDRARRELLEAGGGADLGLMLSVSKAKSYETLTLAELALGRVEDAADWATRAESESGGDDLALGRVAADRARAAVLLASGDAPRAAKLALMAADAAMSVGAVVEAGSARLLAGRALARANDRLQAIATLDTAYDHFTAAGALGYQQQAVAELRRLGRRRRSSTGPGDGSPGALTAREREIADLVAAGKTNRQIAGACYLSEKTVESHLSSIFSKLGVSSRKAVAAATDRLGQARVDRTAS